MDFTNIFNLLKKLDACVPNGEGAVSVTIYADESWRITLELWGIKAATLEPHMRHFYINHFAINDNNPNWLDDIKSLVAKLDSVLDTENKNT